MSFPKYELKLHKSGNRYTLTHEQIRENKAKSGLIFMEIDIDTGKITIYPSGLWNVEVPELDNWTLEHLGLTKIEN